jgi:hypothetical protein
MIRFDHVVLFFTEEAVLGGEYGFELSRKLTGNQSAGMLKLPIHGSGIA